LKIKDLQDVSTCGNHLAVARVLVLHAAGSRRDQDQIVQNRFKTRDLSLSAFDCSIGLVALRYRRR
jgi:hypothetical protein